MPIRISPSLASSPLDRLGATVAELEASGADSLHFDIEDGSFVPAMTLGTKIIADLRPYTQMIFDVHLMMLNPEWLLADLAKNGANRISVHYEACAYPRRILRQIASLGVSAGLALNPATPLPVLSYLNPYLSFVVILTTEPENPDCPFLPETLDKVRVGKVTPGLEHVEWVVDGGIQPENIVQAAQAGADTVVVGRAVFTEGEISRNIRALRQALL